MFSAPIFLKHRVILALMYSAGLRAGELRRLKIADIDTVRMMIHIRQSKNNKDRYVPLSPLVLEGLRKYLKKYKPVEFLFNGSKKGMPISMTGVRFAFCRLKEKCRINKQANLHTLRHSYATHLLEYGMDIVSIKELLGHSRIDTTMVYLHVAKPNRTNLFSPFDRLYRKSKKQTKWYGA
jgi:site-specific recombinase XerD